MGAEKPKVKRKYTPRPEGNRPYGRGRVKIHPITWAQQNPVEWLREALGAQPWGKQRQILESVRDNPKTIVPSCHAAGKSWIAAHTTLWYLYTHPDSIVFTTAPTTRQVEQILWAELRHTWGKQTMPLGGDKPLVKRLQLSDKWFAFGMSADTDPSKFQGIHAVGGVLGVVDEACGIPDQIWEAIKANLSTGDVRLLEIGNPTDPDTVFAKECKSTFEGTKVIRISAFDTPNFTKFGLTLADFRTGLWRRKITGPLPCPWLVTPDFVYTSLHEEGEESPFFRSRILAEFPEVRTDALISPLWVEQAQERWRTLTSGTSLLPAISTPGPKSIGVDVARYGDDKTAIAVKDGIKCWVSECVNGLDTEQVANLAYHRFQLEGGDAVVTVDCDGIGVGVYDQIKRRPRMRVTEYHGSGRPHDIERFENMRSQSWWTVRELLRNGELALDPADRTLAAELCQIRYILTPKGKIKIEAKEDLKKRLGRSPDRADAIVYACAARSSHFSQFLQTYAQLGRR